jgi:flavin-dependent dehydrogenase
MTEVDVAVIGGGVTGLASALALARRGASVCILEREARPGEPPARTTAASFTPASTTRKGH